MPILLTAGLSFWFASDTRTNFSAVIATMGVFVTVYALIFSIVELLRLGSVARTIKAENAAIVMQLRLLSGVKHLSECQAVIDTVIQMIDNDETVPSSSILQILKMYSGHFHKELRQDGSTQSGNAGMLQSYAAASATKRNGLAASRLKKTLIQMTTEITMLLASQTFP